MNSKSDISGFILAGGKSSRMGFDKAFLEVGNKPLLQNMIELIAPFCRYVAISGQNPGYAAFDLEMIADVFSDCGPISGLHSVLQASSTEWNLIVGVDMPFMDEEFLVFLIGKKGDCDAVIPMHQGGMEPMAGLYHKRLLPVVEAQIEKRNFKLTNLLSEVNTRFVDCNFLVRKNRRLFHNMNSMDDYQDI